MTVGGDVPWDAIQDVLQAWVVSGSGLPSSKVVWGQQDAPRPASPAIILRISNSAEIGQQWRDTEPNPLTFAPIAITAVDASTDELTAFAHGLLTGDGPVQLTTSGTLPGGVVALTNFWAIVVDADHLQLAATYADTGGGQGAGNPATAVDLTSAGSGPLTLSATSGTVRAGQEVVSVGRGYERVTLELKCHAVDATGPNMATAILERVRRRRIFPSQTALLEAVNVALIGVDRVRAVLGTRDAVLFEPRSYLDVHFCVVDEESDVPSTVIAVVEVTNQATSQAFEVSLEE